MSTATLSAVTHRTDPGAEGPSSAVPESLLAELQSVPVARDAAHGAKDAVAIGLLLRIERPPHAIAVLVDDAHHHVVVVALRVVDDA